MQGPLQISARLHLAPEAAACRVGDSLLGDGGGAVSARAHACMLLGSRLQGVSHRSWAANSRYSSRSAGRLSRSGSGDQSAYLEGRPINTRGTVVACENGSAGESSAESNIEDRETSAIQLKSEVRGNDTMQATAVAGKALGGDMMKLFSDAQQNMLYLNKQRLMAVDELQKAERDREFLMARVSQLEAEKQAELAQREVLEQQLENVEAALEIAKLAAAADLKKEIKAPPPVLSQTAAIVADPVGPSPKPPLVKREMKGKKDPPTVWSRVLLRIDSMLLSRAISVEQARALRERVVSRDPMVAETFEDLQDKEDAELAGPMVGLLDVNRRKGLHIVQVCTELAPIAQTGSLAPWLTGLCRALRRKGHLVEVVLPKYAFLDTDCMNDLQQVKGELTTYYGGEMYQNKIWTGTVYGLPVTLIEALHPSGFFARDKMYGYEDDFERFSYFCRAALEWLQKTGKEPDVIHLHNWHTAVIAPLFWDIFSHQGMSNTRLLLTCHNFKYQTAVEPEKLSLCGLDPGQLHRPDRLQDNQDPSRANILKGGIVYSNKVTTVSTRYAADVRNSASGLAHGLEQTIATHEHKFVGAPSGVNEDEWDPSRDRFLAAPFSSNDLSGKALAKAELRQRLGLPLVDSRTGVERPLVGCLAPLVSEKELQFIKSALKRTLECGAQFVAVGASKAPRVQAHLEDLQRDHADENAGLVIKYDDAMAHLIVAASDILVCPDTVDPVDQLPLVGLKYGALPVARQQRSKADCIVDVDDPSSGRTKGNGFVFHSDSDADMADALQRAIERISADPEGWGRFVKNAVEADFSWDAASSEAYIEAYKSIQRC